LVSGVAAQQANSAVRPRYRTSRAGDKPFVLFGSDQLLDAAADNAVTACRSGSSTVMMVCGDVRSTGFGFLYTATPSTGHNLFYNGGEAGFSGRGCSARRMRGRG